MKSTRERQREEKRERGKLQQDHVDFVVFFSLISSDLEDVEREKERMYWSGIVGIGVRQNENQEFLLSHSSFRVSRFLHADSDVKSQLTRIELCREMDEKRHEKWKLETSMVSEKFD